MLRLLSISALAIGLTASGCSDGHRQVVGPSSQASSEQFAFTAPAAKVAAGSLVIDSFDQGPQSLGPLGAFNPPNVRQDTYEGPGPIGDRRELVGAEFHPAKTTFTVSGTAPGENRISYIGGFGATAQDLRYGSCIGSSGLHFYLQGSCADPQGLDADFSGRTGVEIDFIDLLGGSAPHTFWMVRVVIHMGGDTFQWFNWEIEFQDPLNPEPFTLSVPFEEFTSLTTGSAPTEAELADVDGIAIGMGNNGNFSSEKKIALGEIRIAGSSDSDGDGVSDDVDACPGTAEGALVDAAGCSGVQNVDNACPAGGAYKNHGAYVSCTSKAAEAQLEAGLLTEEEKDAIVSAAAQSSIGKKK